MNILFGGRRWWKITYFYNHYKLICDQFTGVTLMRLIQTVGLLYIALRRVIITQWQNSSLRMVLVYLLPPWVMMKLQLTNVKNKMKVLRYASIIYVKYRFVFEIFTQFYLIQDVIKPIKSICLLWKQLNMTEISNW